MIDLLVLRILKNVCLEKRVGGTSRVTFFETKPVYFSSLFHAEGCLTFERGDERHLAKTSGA